VRHAQASRVTLRLSVRDGTLEAEITDDGRGLDAAQAEASGPASTDGHGLTNMRSRARTLGGELTVTSAAGGTRVRLAVPVR